MVREMLLFAASIHAVIIIIIIAANIFGIGDCTNVPTSRTAAACAAESAILTKNLLSVMRGESPSVHVRQDNIQALCSLDYYLLV